MSLLKSQEKSCAKGERIMGQFTICNDGYAAYTAIPNKFIDEYMKDANDAQLKVYLYLIRMMSANRATSVSEIADKFNHTEKDVMRALKYWEKADLLSLDYDASKTLTGIRLKDANRQEHSANTQPSATFFAEAPIMTTPAASVRTTEAPVLTSPLAMQMPVMTIVSKTAEVTTPAENAAPVADPYAKPSYSADQLRSFKDKSNTSQLLFVAQEYIGHPLTVSEMKSILYFSDCLHFSDDLIDYLIQYCVDRGKRDFKYIEKVALNWAQSGITTPKQAEKFAAKYDKSVYTIMKELGKNSSPTTKELEYINRWIKEYGFSTDIITEACERTVLATDSHRFEYAEGILSSWKKENVHRKSDIQRIDELYQKRRQQKASTPSSGNRFNQFSPTNYDFSELEAKLLSK